MNCVAARNRRSPRGLCLFPVVLLFTLLGPATAPNTRATLAAYDAVVAADVAGGLVPLARLTNAATFNDVNQTAFNFGNTSGDTTIEFILAGDPVAGGPDGYLAVGANATSNLRFEQWSDTGQMGFTQLGVADYLFAPAVPTPTQPVHLAYVWQAASRTMKLYLNGSLAGTRTGVDASFAMPAGQGWLGNNAGGSEGMVGTLYRVTVYKGLVSDTALQRHADAYNDILRPPILVSFTASPDTIFTPASTTLSWAVQNALGVRLNGTDVTGLNSRIVFPNMTTTYTLIATNAGGSVTGQVTVVVNPAPRIRSFTTSKAFAGAGETVSLAWDVAYADSFVITPGVGEVTSQTVNGAGTYNVLIGSDTNFTLTAGSVFGNATAAVAITRVFPANHLVISEIMADNATQLADENGDFSDWIEIYNPTAAPVNLLGWFLTDDPGTPTQWAFPELVLPAGGYQLVFASGKNRRVAGAPLHTNFQLAKGGEYLALIGPGLIVVHAFAPYPAQLRDVSYGLIGGDRGLVQYLGVPTPGTANNATPAPPAMVQFSRTNGLFTGSFSLALTTETPGAVIRYTLNGSTPNTTNGTAYISPLNIAATTRIRAVAIRAGSAGAGSSANFIRLAPDLASYTSSLPILVIENFGAGIIPQKGWSGNGSGVRQLPRQDAVWATFERQGGVAGLTGAPDQFSRIAIRGRGAFSSTWRQKPYSVEVLDDVGDARDVGPLGLPADNDWTLYFPDPDSNKDPSLLFNTFAYELSRNCGNYAVKFRWVEAFINEDGGDLKLADRRGVYAIIEKVSRGNNRLDFQPLSADGSSGGWLLNINRMDAEPENGWPAENGATQPQFFHTAGPNRIVQTPPNAQVVGDDEPQQGNGYLNFDNPGGYTINTNQRAAIEGWFKQFEDVLWSNALWRDPTNGYRRYLDPVDFADYFVLNTLTHNGDGLLISLFPWKGDDNRLRMGPAWDFNWSAYYISGVTTGDLLWRSEQLWYERLFTDPDFMQLFIDRWWEFRRGPMSNAAMNAIIDGQAADISPAKALLNGLPSTADWTNRLTQMKTWLRDRANWIDSNFLRPPTFNQNGGEVPDGFQVLLLGGSGTLYYTVNGTDPRAPGGAVAAAAQAYQLPLNITAPTTISARVRSGANWSGLSTAVFYPPQDLSRLVVTEMMYNSPPFGAFAGDDLEFLELKNSGPTTLNLGTLTFTAGITFTFTNGTLLLPGQFLVLARNAAAFQAKYPGVTIHGLYTGRLDNGGETLRLSTPSGSTVWSVAYNDRAPWPLAADGYDFSVVPRDAATAPNSDDGAFWRASANPDGSPGTDDPLPGLPAIVINEVLAQTVPPAVDWIELYNPTASPVNLGGWFLSDDGSAPRKFRIPAGTTVPAGGFRTFSEADFNTNPASALSFSLNASGDAVYLSSGDTNTNLTGYSHGFTFGAAAPGATFGRYVNSVGEEQFPAQISASEDTVNTGPRVGPVVIHEIHYHPEAGGDEFVELRNITSNPVPLYDPIRPTNTWRLNGLGFSFPTNVLLGPQGLLLIVGGDPAGFRARYQVPAAVPILGPFSGALQDSGERLELQYPDAPDTNGLPYITVDEVRYNDRAPWPPAADGSGASLQRRVAAAYGNDPANWEAARPTPGGDPITGTAPVITSHSTGRTVIAGDTVSFEVTATGTPPLYYQWLYNGAPLAGATNPSLLLANVQPVQSGMYGAVVYNDTGSAISAPAMLTVQRPLTIYVAPTNQYLRPGSNAVFNVVASGIGIPRYQWRRDGTNLIGATSSLLTITNVQPAHQGAYTVQITDNIGPVTSPPALLVLLYEPVIIQQPLSQAIATGGTVTLSVSVTNTANLPIGYRWRRGTVSVPGGLFVLNSHTAFFTITNARAPQTNYNVAITNLARTAALISSNALLTLLPDTDNDGLPNVWELAYGLNPANASDRNLDSDHDGQTNAEEYQAGTNPTNSLSTLTLGAITRPPGATVSFAAVSNRTYSVHYTDTLAPATWFTLRDIVARPTNRVEVLTDPGYTTNRFYRLVTPRTEPR